MSTNLTSTTVLYKQPREKIPASMDFVNIIQPGDTITGTPYITVEPSGYIALYSITSRDNVAYVTIGSGVTSQDYRFDFEVTTTSGYIYIADGYLKVRSR
jgi:hypothetical protein